MPSFDVVSEIDRHELANAIDQANRELSQRFDFKDTGCKYEFKENLKDAQTNLAEARQDVALRHGIDQECGKKIVKLLKESKLKVQGAIHGEKVRVTGKQRDDLQDAIALLRKQEFDRPLSYDNFRD